jgi:DNA-binding transcriptional ArsR family regulator
MGYMSLSRRELVYHAIGDPTRRAILDRLARRPLAAGAVAGRFRISRPAISKHLRVLARAGLVKESRAGRHRYYSLTPAPLRAVDHWLERYRAFWTANLRQLQEYAERDSRRT